MLSPVLQLQIDPKATRPLSSVADHLDSEKSGIEGGLICNKLLVLTYVHNQIY